MLYIVIFTIVKATEWGIHLESHGEETVPGIVLFKRNNGT